MKSKIYPLIKRGTDILLSSILLVVSTPLSLFIALLLLWDEGRPILFVQTRIGKGGKPFRILKFRTLCTSAPANLSAKEIGDPDRYTTRIGRFLRNTGFDELPQLLCVLTGKMSLVGPRPVIPEEKELIRMRDLLGVYALRPGLTGLAQIRGGAMLDDQSKAAWDAVYLKRVSPLYDLGILGKTARLILFSRVFRRYSPVSGMERNQI